MALIIKKAREKGREKAIYYGFLPPPRKGSHVSQITHTLINIHSQWCPVSNCGMFDCDIAHRRSVSVLCMLYEIRCNPVHPHNGALPGPYVPVLITRGALVAHRYTYAPPRCRTVQYSRTFIPLTVSLRNDLANPVFDGVRLAGFKSRANAFLLA